MRHDQELNLRRCSTGPTRSWHDCK